eukprot:COSAG01_NODE_1008_length_12157_cov_17.425029_3_plen_55_part_00
MRPFLTAFLYYRCDSYQLLVHLRCHRVAVRVCRVVRPVAAPPPLLLPVVLHEIY